MTVRHFPVEIIELLGHSTTTGTALALNKLADAVEYSDADYVKRLRKAAAVLIREEARGRQPFDDDRALAEAQDLVRRKKARSMRAAFIAVARTKVHRSEVDAMVERLRRKAKKGAT